MIEDTKRRNGKMTRGTPKKRHTYKNERWEKGGKEGTGGESKNIKDEGGAEGTMKNTHAAEGRE